MRLNNDTHIQSDLIHGKIGIPSPMGKRIFSP